MGYFAGLMDGMWWIHDWKGPGVLTFLLDYIWGLAGTTIGALLHLVDLFWGDHVDEPRHGAHRYESGFRFKANYAVTLGSVLSDNTHGPARHCTSTKHWWL